MTVSGIKAVNTTGTWNDNTYTLNNISYELLTDNGDNVIGIKVTTGSGGASAVTSLRLSADFRITTGSYVVSGCPATGSSSTYGFDGIYFKSDSTEQYSNDYGSGSNVNMTADYADARLVVVVRSGYSAPASGLIFKPMFCSSTASNPTSFSPYSNICPISGRTETSVSTRNEDNTETASATISFGQTVYGGQVDFKTGRVRVSKKTITLDGNAGTNYGFLDFWESSTTWTKYMGRTQRDVGCRQLANQTADICAISDRFKAVPENERENAWTITGVTNIDDAIYLNFGADSGLDTTAKQLAWLANNPVQVCFDLKTPQELTLTPSQLQMLKGYNSVTGDGVITITAYTGSSYPVEITRKRKTKKKGGK